MSQGDNMLSVLGVGGSSCIRGRNDFLMTEKWDGYRGTFGKGLIRVEVLSRPGDLPAPPNQKTKVCEMVSRYLYSTGRKRRGRATAL